MVVIRQSFFTEKEGKRIFSPQKRAEFCKTTAALYAPGPGVAVYPEERSEDVAVWAGINGAKDGGLRIAGP